MQKIVLLFWGFIAFKSVRADYDPLTLSKLIDKSELIAQCKVIQLSEGYFEIQVIEILKGSLTTNKIKVEKFQNWTCASRYSDYHIGQVELIFLTKNVYHDYWNILGAGNEGEMLIENNFLYYEAKYSIGSEKLDSIPLGKGVFWGFQYSLSDVTIGIREYLRDRKTIVALIDKKKIKSYKTKNPFLLRIIKEFENQLG